MNRLNEDCPMDNYIPVDQTCNSVADKEPVEVQCTPTSVVTAGSTTRMLWLKIKDALASLSTTVSGYINTAKTSLEASIAAAKNAAVAASTAATGAKTSADEAKTAAVAARTAVEAIDIPSSVASETSLLATKDQVESVLVALITSIHEDYYGNANTEINVAGKRYILVGKEGTYWKYMCFNYSGLEVLYTSPNPVVGGMSYKKSESGTYTEYSAISEVGYFTIARKTDLPTDYAKAGTTAKTLDDITIDTSNLATASALSTLQSKLVNSTTGTTIESAVNKVKDNVGNFADGKSAATELASISQELGNLSAIFSGITAQDITDEYNAE